MSAIPFAYAGPVARYVARRAVAGAARYLPYVAGAAKAGYSAYKRARTDSGVSAVSAKRGSAVTNVSSRGKFSRRKRGPRAKRTYKRKRARKSATLHGETYHATHGTTTTFEVSGTVSDPDCVYIGHAPYVPEELMKVIVAAVLRRLYFKAIEWDCTNQKDYVPYRAGNSAGHTISVAYGTAQDSNAGTFSHHLIGPNQSFSQVAEIILQKFLDFSGGGSADNQNGKLQYIELTDTTSGDLKARINLINLQLELHCVSTLKIQNTSFATGGSSEADDVHNIPLIGKSYTFKGISPSPTDIYAGKMSIVGGASGMTLCRSHENGTATIYESWREPPVAKAFTNCKTSCKVQLPPGSIKSDVVVFKKRLAFEPFIRALRLRNVEPTSSTQGGMLGTSAMIALEKMISISGAGNIRTNYECNFLMGASVFEKHRPVAMQKVVYLTRNSDPA
uniref:Capsid protein n=1 Tax=Cressdnaviricota sp. TaxID=2748378 RepID=A0A6M3YPY9_9VIRU|nr:MAG: capsid protein [Cressdnaviricota sp.]